MALTIGQAMQKCRYEKTGLSRKKVAELSGVTEHTLQYYELDKCNPSLFNVIQLADFYGVSLDELIGRTVKNGAANNRSTAEKI